VVRGTPSGLFLFLRFELVDECSETRGDRSCESVVLDPEALPNCRQRNASIASGTLRGLRTILNDMPNSDHTDHALWFGGAMPLRLDVLRKA
jgi:hypothetical protein